MLDAQARGQAASWLPLIAAVTSARAELCDVAEIGALLADSIVPSRSRRLILTRTNFRSALGRR